MKSSICCAFMIAMLFVSSAAFGDIIESDYDWDSMGSGEFYVCGNPPESEGFAWACGDEDAYSSYAAAAGHMSYLVTQDNVDCEWEFWLKAYAVAQVKHIVLYTGSYWAYAEFYAEADLPGTDDDKELSDCVQIDEEYHTWDYYPYIPSNPDDIHESGSGEFDEGEGLDMTQGIFVVAQVYDGNTEEPKGHAESYACGILEVE